MVKIIGAGPGAKDLITVRGMRALQEADIIIYAGSLVNEELLEYAKKECEIYNSAYMNLDEVIDVIVEHELYGELVEGLYIATPDQIQSFMKKYRSSNSRLLSQLTNGIHLHTIRYQNEASLAKIKEALANKGILYQGND